jgi:hypothetical protein
MGDRAEEKEGARQRERHRTCKRQRVSEIEMETGKGIGEKERDGGQLYCTLQYISTSSGWGKTDLTRHFNILRHHFNSERSLFRFNPNPGSWGRI